MSIGTVGGIRFRSAKISTMPFAVALLADTSAAYWFAGVLTSIAAVIVMGVMLFTSSSRDDETL